MKNKLLDSASDFAFAELKRHGKEPSSLPVPLRTVVIVYSAHGIIDNGGLQYFFEADFPGNPPYSVFVDAYRAIGAEAEATALAEAVKLFPFEEPHLHMGRRDEFLGQFEHGGGDRTDSPLEPFTNTICGSEAVWQLLASYVANHASAFQGGADAI